MSFIAEGVVVSRTEAKLLVDLLGPAFMRQELLDTSVPDELRSILSEILRLAERSDVEVTRRWRVTPSRLRNIATLVHAGCDVTAIMEAEGVGERHARRLMALAREAENRVSPGDQG